MLQASGGAGGSGSSGGRAGKWGERLKWMAGLAVSYGLFVWSHPPTAYQFSLGYGVAMVVLAAVKRQWRGLAWVGVGLAVGVALAAAYLLPAMLEQNFIHKDYILSSWPYHNTYVFVHDIFNAANFVDFYRRINWLWVLGLA